MSRLYIDLMTVSLSLYFDNNYHKNITSSIHFSFIYIQRTNLPSLFIKKLKLIFHQMMTTKILNEI